MLKKKVVALIEVTRARKVLADAKVKLDEILTHSELELANEYSDTLKELATLRQKSARLSGSVEPHSVTKPKCAAS